jgi:thiamine-phosphate pyrophosphorylase
VSLPRPPLLVITDRRLVRQPLETVVRAILAAGCRWLLLREKDMDASAREALLVRLVALAAPHSARVMVHGDARAAARIAGVAGVHLAEAGGAVEVARARQALPAGALLGQSVHDRAAAAAALTAGADYVTFGPVFPSLSKPGYGPGVGACDALAALAGAWPGRIVALGGITPANAALCRKAGAAAVATLGAVMAAARPEEVVAGFIESLAGEDGGASDSR